MSWTTSWNICKIDDCDRSVECKGLCSKHYQRFKAHGDANVTKCWGQSTHPMYNMWNERLNANLLCNEWKDFGSFLIGVGERPDGDFRMGRKNRKEVFGPDNFYWKEYSKRREGETRNQHASRRRYEDLPRYKTYELRKSFNIEYDEFYKMLESQNFVCKICKEPEKVIHHVSKKLKALAVDHNHKTEKIRGLLCQRCNRVLGKVGDNIKLLADMILYLRSYEN
jgi:hypothetical protein